MWLYGIRRSSSYYLVVIFKTGKHADAFSKRLGLVCQTRNNKKSLNSQWKMLTACTKAGKNTSTCLSDSPVNLCYLLFKRNVLTLGWLCSSMCYKIVELKLWIALVKYESLALVSVYFMIPLSGTFTCPPLSVNCSMMYKPLCRKMEISCSTKC